MRAGSTRRVIKSPAGIAVNFEDIHDHLKGIANGLDLGLGVEMPVDRDFDDAIAAHPGDVEQLDIEGKVRQGLMSKEVFGNGGAKTLEATLGVAHPRQRQKLDDPIDRPPAPMTVRGLIIADRSGQFSGGDGDIEIGAFGRKKFVHFGDGHGEIDIAHEAKLTLGREHPPADGESFARLFFLQHDAIGITLSVSVGNRQGTVAAAILDDQHFGRIGLSLQKSEDLLQGIGQAVFFVVNGKDDRKKRVLLSGWVQRVAGSMTAKILNRKMMNYAVMMIITKKINKMTISANTNPPRTIH